MKQDECRTFYSCYQLYTFHEKYTYKMLIDIFIKFIHDIFLGYTFEYIIIIKYFNF